MPPVGLLRKGREDVQCRSPSARGSRKVGAQAALWFVDTRAMHQAMTVIPKHTPNLVSLNKQYPLLRSIREYSSQASGNYTMDLRQWHSCPLPVPTCLALNIFRSACLS